MTATPEDAPEEEFPPFMSPTAVRRMTVAVVVMGVILLVGFATLVGLIIYKSSTAKKAEIARNKPAVISAEEARRLYGAGDTAKFVSAQIPKNAKITNVTVDGNRAFITVEDGGGTSIMMFDTDAWRVQGVARFSYAEEGK